MAQVTIRLLDCGPQDGAEIVVTETPPEWRVPQVTPPEWRVPQVTQPGDPPRERVYKRLGFQARSFDSGGKIIWGDCILYVWAPLLAWMKRG